MTVKRMDTVGMMRTPDGHSRLELSRFDAPAIGLAQQLGQQSSRGNPMGRKAS